MQAGEEGAGDCSQRRKERWEERWREAAGGRSKLQSSTSSRGLQVNNVTVHLLHRRDVNRACAPAPG